MKVSLDENAIMPKRAHILDAGYDLYSRDTKVVPAHGNACFDTGVHMAIPKHFAGVLISKSGLNVKHDITNTGLIDSGYTGSICVKLYNNGDNDYVVNVGDKISQIVFLLCFSPRLKRVKSLDKTERGNNGFGSTGK